jgi:hypothetical protein
VNVSLSLLLHWLPFLAALLQLIGTALVVWGLRIDSGETAFEGKDGKEWPLAVVRKGRPRAFKWGVRFLLGGLALQVVAAGLSAG